MHELNQQCEAKAKATGRRCERRVVGGSVCYVHGGNAKQVKAKREQRVALAEVKAAVPATVVVQKEPEELLLDALHDVNAVLQQIKAELHDGSINPILLQLAGDWLDRLGRLGKIITDGDLSTKLHTRLGWLAQDRVAQINAMLAGVVLAAPLTAQQRLDVWLARFDGLRLWGEGQVPARMVGDAVHQFTADLDRAVAEERAAAEGWLEPEPDVDGDSGDVGVPLLFGDGEVA